MTLIGKKQKIKPTDFHMAMCSTGLEDEIIKNIFVKLIKALGGWLEFIDISFFPEEMKELYK